MALNLLPNEVLTQILQDVWDLRPNIPPFIAFRLISPTFDDVVSRLTLQNVSPLDLDIGRRSEWRLSLQWMLVTKARIHIRDSHGPFAFILDAAHHLASDIQLQTRHDFNFNHAIETVCQLIVAGNDPSWVVHHLVTWIPGNTLPEGISHLETYTRKGRVGDGEEDLYGTLHLAIACSQVATIQSYIAPRLNKDGPELKLYHGLFGEAFRVSVLMEQPNALLQLLQCGAVNPNAIFANDGFKTILLYACEMHKESVVMSLLLNYKDKISLNYQTNLGRNALLWAVRRSWTEAVRILLGEESVDPNLGTKWHDTPLSAACKNQDLQLVRMLLDHKQIEPKFGIGRNCPMWIALDNGSTDIVSLFLDRYGDRFALDQVMRKGQTPLSIAAEGGHLNLVRLLLSHPDVHPSDETDSPRLEPLWLAVEKNHPEVARELLEYGDENIDRNHSIEDHVTKAVDLGHDEVLQVFAEHIIATTDPEISGDFMKFDAPESFKLEVIRGLSASPKLREKYKHNLDCALGQAATNGEVNILRELVQYEETNINALFSDTWSILELAIRGRGPERIVPFIMTQEGFDINPPHLHDTPLTTLASHGDIQMMKLLMQYPRVDINARGSAYDVKRWEFVPSSEVRDDQILSPRYPFQPCQFSGRPGGKQTALLEAATRKQILAFDMLLKDPRTSLRARDAFGRTPLWWVVYWGNETMIKMLLNRATEEEREYLLNAQDDDGWAPLHVAVNSGSTWLVRKLLRQPGIDPNLATKGGWTALHISMSSCSNTAMELLLDHPRIDTSLKLDDGRTAFDIHEDCPCKVLAWGLFDED